MTSKDLARVEEELDVIGHSGCGDYYAIDTDDDESPVYFYNHEIGEFDEREGQESIEAFAAEPPASVKRVNQAIKKQRGSR